MPTPSSHALARTGPQEITAGPAQPACPEALPGARRQPGPHRLTQRLTALGFSVDHHHWRDQHELIIGNITGARSCLTLSGTGWAQWHYEPATGTATSAVTLTGIIEHILGAPHAAEHIPGAAAYRAFPLKGAVGRYVQDRGLTVTLRVSEDLESFEATTDIEVTSPARPWLGTVRLSDNGHLEWDCDYRTAFHGDVGALAGVIIPILRAALTLTRDIP